MTPKPHFFKAYSRLGIINKPARQKTDNIGVEHAPDFILTPSFLKTIPDFDLENFTFSSPEKLSKIDYWQKLTQELIAFKNQINQSLKPNQTQIVIGGDNSVSFSALLSLLDRVKDPSKIGYIHFDSHGDFSNSHFSISGNFHGMYLRPFFDNFDLPNINSLVTTKLNPNQTLFIGDLILDGDEVEFFQSKHLKNITNNDFLKNPQKEKNKIKEFIKSYDYLHINFDIDVFKKEVAGATGMPNDGRWGKLEIFSILDILKLHPQISLDLSEVNPKKKRAQKTIQISQQIINTILKL